MKLKIKSVLKSTHSEFECFEDQQIIIRSGNTLCIKEIGKPDGQFICLSNSIETLYFFKPSTNKKAIFTAQKSDNLVELAQYNLKGERKSISLIDQSPFFAEIDSIQLLVDEYDNNLVYGSAKSKESACVFLADFSKTRILGVGYLTLFEDIKVDSRENMTLSICGHNGNCNFIKSLRYSSGSWEVEEQLYKKIHNGIAFQHQILFGGRILIATKQAFYIFTDTELIQTVNFWETQNKTISEILKFPKGIMVRLSNDYTRIFIEDSDEATMINKGEISIELNPDDKIRKMQLSFSNQEVVLRTIKNNLYVWRCENIDLESGNSQFNLVESSCNSQKYGNISLSTGRNYCLLSGPRVVTLWSVQKNQYVLSSEFSNSAQPQKKVIFACAINPDGNSFILAFQDRIKIYKILLTKFKLLAQFQIKRCQQIIYSHGGQLVACKFGKGVNSCLSIINTLRLVELGILKIQSEPKQIVWNELDDEILVSTQNNFLQYYNIAENARKHSVKFESQISYVRIDYKIRRVLVSSKENITVLEDGKIIEIIHCSLPNFDYVFPLYGVYLAASTTGVLYWSTSLRFQTFEQFSLFTRSKFQMVCRSGYLLAYSSFDDVTILQCIRPDHAPKRPVANQIVSVQHQEIIDFFDRVKAIQANFDKLQDSTQAKLQEEKNSYEGALRVIKSQFQRQISFLNEKYSDITMEKLKQDRATEKIFQSLENGQAKNVNQLQRMYERKLAMEREKCMNLQQLNMQQKIKYQKVIYQLQSRCHREVSIVRDQYSKNVKLQSNRADEVKKHHLQQKQMLEARIMNLQEQNDITLGTLQLNKDSIIQNMRSKHQHLEEMNETLQIKNHNQKIFFEQLETKNQQNERELRRVNLKLQENANRIRLLQADIRRKDQMIDERNQIITEQGHKIQELQKAKYVLSFRATQIRKELQPKQTLTDKLRSQLLKLDEEFKQEKRKAFDLRQKISKLEQINQQSKKQNSDLKQSIKHKQRIHDELCSQIFTIVNTLDPNQWSPAIIKIYQSYIKEDKFKTRTANKNKEDMSEEMSRHLNHVEQSLLHATKGNQKIIKAKEKDIVRKMKQNSQLLYAINQMKKSQKEKNELAAVALQKIKNEATKAQALDSNRNSTRAQTSHTGGITRRVAASREIFSRQKETFLEFHDIESARQQNAHSRNRNRISSAHKTILYQGVKREQSSKIIDMAKELQLAKSTIKRQGLIIEELNNRLFALPEVETH